MTQDIKGRLETRAKELEDLAAYAYGLDPDRDHYTAEEIALDDAARLTREALAHITALEEKHELLAAEFDQAVGTLEARNAELDALERREAAAVGALREIEAIPWGGDMFIEEARRIARASLLDRRVPTPTEPSS